MLATMPACFSRLMSAAIISTILATSLLSTARADTYTFAPFSVAAPGIDHFNPQYGIYNLTGAPAGTVYNSFTATVDWSTFLSDYSDEALAGLYSNKPGNSSAIYAPVYFADNGKSSPDDIQLHWGGNLATAYTGGNTLHFAYAQNFPNSEAYWQNVTITLNTAFIPVTPPSSTFVPFSQSDTSYTATVYSQAAEWYSFRYLGGQLTIDTQAPDLAPYFVLYDSLGRITASQSGTGMNLDSTRLTQGELYYLALVSDEGRNFYNSDYRIVSNSFSEGDYQINFAVSGAVIPETGSANLFLIGSLPVIAGISVMKQRRKSVTHALV